MSRPLRIEYENAYYHVVNRGRGRRLIYPDTPYYQDYLQCLAEVNSRFGVEVHAYCLMGNHYHLLLKTPQGNLSRAMRHIDGVYTQRHNRRKKTDGPLFRGRYKAIVIDASAYLLQVSRYIHRNPIELKSPLVKDLITYPWSSYAAYLNRDPAPDWLYCDTVYGELGSHHKYNAYCRYVENGNDRETDEFYQRKNIPSIWGTKTFKENAMAQATATDQEVNKKGLQTIVPMDQVIHRVAKYYQLPTQEIRIAKRGKGMKQIPRWIAMKLCQEKSSAKLQDIAKVFNVTHYSTVSQTVARLNQLLKEDKATQLVFNMLSQDLTP